MSGEKNKSSDGTYVYIGYVILSSGKIGHKMVKVDAIPKDWEASDDWQYNAPNVVFKGKGVAYIGELIEVKRQADTFKYECTHRTLEDEALVNLFRVKSKASYEQVRSASVAKKAIAELDSLDNMTLKDIKKAFKCMAPSERQSVRYYMRNLF